MHYKTSESFGKQTFFSCMEHLPEAKPFLHSLKKCNKTAKNVSLILLKMWILWETVLTHPPKSITLKTLTL